MEIFRKLFDTFFTSLLFNESRFYWFTFTHFYVFLCIDFVLNKSKIELLTTLNSAKDYISIESVTSMILDISLSKSSEIYNIANGENLSNEDLLSIIKQFFDFEYSINNNAKQYSLNFESRVYFLRNWVIPILIHLKRQFYIKRL